MKFHWGAARIRIVTTVVGLLAPAVAQAQPADVPFVDSFSLESSRTRSTTNGDERSPIGAGVLSAGATLGGALAVVAGVRGGDRTEEALGGIAFAVGPSVGHWYGGERWNTGTSTRLGGVLVGGAGLALTLACDHGARDSTCSVGDDLLVAGVTAYVVGALYEIATAPRAAREHNRRAFDARLMVAPVAARDSMVPGLALAGRF